MAKAADREKLRQDIILSTIEVFNDRGVTFTMSDVATNIHISKKTIYKEFDTKEELLDTVVDYIFDNIKAKEEQIMNDIKAGTAYAADKGGIPALDANDIEHMCEIIKDQNRVVGV